MVQRWRARWVDLEGQQREFVFDSLNSFMIARIDFKLKFKYAFEDALPEQYAIEEVAYGGNVYQRAKCTLLGW